MRGLRRRRQGVVGWYADLDQISYQLAQLLVARASEDPYGPRYAAGNRTNQRSGMLLQQCGWQVDFVPDGKPNAADGYIFLQVAEDLWSRSRPERLVVVSGDSDFLPVQTFAGRRKVPCVLRSPSDLRRQPDPSPESTGGRVADRANIRHGKPQPTPAGDSAPQDRRRIVEEMFRILGEHSDRTITVTELGKALHDSCPDEAKRMLGQGRLSDLVDETDGVALRHPDPHHPRGRLVVLTDRPWVADQVRQMMRATPHGVLPLSTVNAELWRLAGPDATHRLGGGELLQKLEQMDDYRLLLPDPAFPGHRFVVRADLNPATIDWATYLPSAPTLRMCGTPDRTAAQTNGGVASENRQGDVIAENVRRTLERTGTPLSLNELGIILSKQEGVSRHSYPGSLRSVVERCAGYKTVVPDTRRPEHVLVVEAGQPQP